MQKTSRLHGSFTGFFNHFTSYWFVTLACCLLLYASSSLGQSTQTEPFHVRNMNPFTLLHGLPVATSSDLLDDDVSSLRIQWDVSNTSMETLPDNEQVTLDGETNRLALTWKRGLGAGWQIGVEVPYLSHRGGGLDSLIENWHDLFGFSNSDRDDWEQNQLRYLYKKDGVTEVAITEEVRGFGDIQFQLSRGLSLANEEQRASAHFSVKLPTGDEDSLLGSGAPDISIWLSGSDRELLEEWPIGGYGQIGVLLMGKAEILEDEQREFVVFGTLGTSWRVYEWLDLKMQFDAHTPFYKSKSDQLGGSAVMFTFGGSIPFKDGSQIDISLGENMTTDMVPDLIINLGYKTLF
ncbi:MAG: DUF3187 family protein [Candidatus Thiodiazotropha sp. L084R]